MTNQWTLVWYERNLSNILRFNNRREIAEFIKSDISKLTNESEVRVDIFPPNTFSSIS